MTLEKHKRLLRLVSVAATYFLVAWVVFAGVEIHTLVTYSRQWSSAEQNMVIVEKVFSDLKDVESGQRGYIITGDVDYLSQYSLGRSALEYDTEVLQAYTEPDRIQHARVREMLGVIRAKIIEMDSALAAFKFGGFISAQVIIRTNKSARQMKHIRYLMDVIRAREQTALKETAGFSF